MKTLAVFAILVTAVVSYPAVKTWTLFDIPNIHDVWKTEPHLYPYIMSALDRIMFSLFTRQNKNMVQAVVASPTGEATWNISDLMKASKDPATNREVFPFIKEAVQMLNIKNATGNATDSIEVLAAGLDISTWTQSDLTKALKDPTIKPALLPYLKKAQEELTLKLSSGEKQANVTIITPVGLVPLDAGVVPLFIQKKSLL